MFIFQKKIHKKSVSYENNNITHSHIPIYENARQLFIQFRILLHIQTFLCRLFCDTTWTENVKILMKNKHFSNNRLCIAKLILFASLTLNSYHCTKVHNFEHSLI